MLTSIYRADASSEAHFQWRTVLIFTARVIAGSKQSMQQQQWQEGQHLRWWCSFRCVFINYPSHSALLPRPLVGNDSFSRPGGWLLCMKRLFSIFKVPSSFCQGSNLKRSLHRGYMLPFSAEYPFMLEATFFRKLLYRGALSSLPFVPRGILFKAIYQITVLPRYILTWQNRRLPIWSFLSAARY